MKKAAFALSALLSACSFTDDQPSLERYVLVRHSAGRIVDVYKTTQGVWCDQLAQCRIGKNYNDAQIRVFGEIKLLRIQDTSEWDSYVEYHSEQETLTYEQKLAAYRK